MTLLSAAASPFGVASSSPTQGTRRSLREEVEARLRAIEATERKRVQEEAQRAAADRATEAQRVMQEVLDSRLAALEADKVRFEEMIVARERAEAS